MLTRGERVEERLAVQGGCGQLDVAANHDSVRYLERWACCGEPLSQPLRQVLEGSYGDNGIPSRDQGVKIDVCVGFGIGIDCV